MENNKLMSRPEWITDSTGKITGYKTPGGADTVFPFNSVEWFDQLQRSSYVFNIGAGTYTRTYPFPSGSNVLAICGFYVKGENAGNLDVHFNRAAQAITFAGTTGTGFQLTVYYVKAPN